MKAHVFFAPLVVAFGVWLAAVVWSGPSGAEPSETTGPEPTVPPPTTTVRLEKRVEGKGAKGWHRVAVRYLNRVRSLAITIRRDPDVSTAINVGCATYRVSCSTLWRKASCESHLYPGATNQTSGAAGLFQFLWSTWRSTPYGRFSPYNAYAASLAAAWMHRAGRGGEWVCR